MYIYNIYIYIHIHNIYIHRQFIYELSISKYGKWKIPFYHCLLQVIQSMQSIQCLAVVVTT